MQLVVLGFKPGLDPEFTPLATAPPLLPHPPELKQVQNSFFLPHQNAQYEFKETAGNFTSGLSQPGAYCPYEPTLGQYQYDR